MVDDACRSSSEGFLQSLFKFIPSNEPNEDGRGRAAGQQKCRSSVVDASCDTQLAHGRKCHKDKHAKRGRHDSGDDDGDKMELSKNSNSDTAAMDAAVQGSRPSQLHDKLHERIMTCKGKRCKGKTREEILAARRERKKNKKLQRRKKKSSGASAKSDSDDNTKIKLAKTSQKSRPIFKDGKLVFSKFDFSEEKKVKNRSLSGLMGKDYKKILKTLDQRKQKIEAIKSEDETAARDLNKRDAWDVAMSKVQGLKVKDDRALVAKAARHKEQREKRSQRRWKSRENTVAQLMKEKQDKRTANIHARRQQKIDHKVKRAKKKGRVPGF